MKINRDEWLRGISNKSRLLDDNGKRCCLGIYARVLGIKDSEILNINGPSGCLTHDKWPNWLLVKTTFHVCSTDVLLKLIDINDSPNISEEARERGIAEIFRKNGVEVEFE